MPEIASATSVSKTITREPVTFPLEDPQVPEIAPTSTDPKPLILGTPILHVSCKMQLPPWQDLISRGISPMAATVVRSHLQAESANWRILTKNQWVLQTVTEGYHTPLTKQETMPYNHHFSSENQNLLQEEIHALLEKQAV